jgi:hypothetical protein
MKLFKGTIVGFFLAMALVLVSGKAANAWWLSFPGGAVELGSGRGTVCFPYGSVKWGPHGGMVVYPGGGVKWGHPTHGHRGYDPYPHRHHHW